MASSLVSLSDILTSNSSKNSLKSIMPVEVAPSTDAIICRTCSLRGSNPKARSTTYACVRRERREREAVSDHAVGREALRR